jgi:phosphatidylethanolamine/phosphatidyl-N-methylethanolamine N-methyltransferase
MAGRGRADKDTLNQHTLNKAYARWAPVYDKVFGKVFSDGRSASIEAAEKIGGRILDVGIGTGISLEEFSRDNRIVGVDISEPMLRRAHKRVVDLNLTNVECIAVMDAAKLGFPDDFFDVVVAQYVITAVPNPDATLDEFMRVTKPGGEVILVNHIGADSGPRYMFERSFAPIARRLGWRPEFRWSRIAQWLDHRPGVTLIERRPMPPMGHFSMIRLGKSASASRAA